jgi:hypothetical protein
MIHPKILIEGKYRPDDITISISESNRKTTPEIENQLEDLWQIKLKKAQEAGKNIYNGLSYRLNALNIKEGKICLEFSIFDFKTRECLLDIPGYDDMPEEYWRKGCHTASTVQTSDGKFVMVELSGKSMNLNATDLIGGIMETDPELKEGKDIFESLYKELNEEAFIAKDDIKEAYINALYLNTTGNIGFYFMVNLSISSKDLMVRFNTQQKELDIKSLIIFSKEEYLNHLRNHNLNKRFLAPFIESNL